MVVLWRRRIFLNSFRFLCARVFVTLSACVSLFYRPPYSPPIPRAILWKARDHGFELLCFFNGLSPPNIVSKEMGSYVFRLRERVDVRKHCEGERL